MAVGSRVVGDDEPFDGSSVDVQTFMFEVGHVSCIGLASAWLLESGSGSRARATTADPVLQCPQASQTKLEARKRKARKFRASFSKRMAMCLSALPKPPAQLELPLTGASAFDAEGNSDELPFELAGELSVTGDQVVITYEHDGLRREVVYDVAGLGAAPWS